MQARKPPAISTLEKQAAEIWLYRMNMEIEAWGAQKGERSQRAKPQPARKALMCLCFVLVIFHVVFFDLCKKREGFPFLSAWS